MEAAGSFETLVSLYKITRRHIQEDGFHIRRRENKSHFQKRLTVQYTSKIVLLISTAEGSQFIIRPPYLCGRVSAPIRYVTGWAPKTV
jgi:hypothetical protein